MAITASSAAIASTSEDAAPMVRIPRIAALALLMLLVPMDIRFMIGDFRLTPYRLVFILLFPLIVWKMIGPSFRWRLHDGLILFVGLWVVLSSMVHFGALSGLETGGVVALEVIMAYFIARTLVTTRAEWLGILKVLFFASVIIMPLMALEAFSHELLIMNMARMIMGDGWLTAYGLEPNTIRLGMLRSPGTFSHPIHAGVFAASLSSLLFYGLLGMRRQFGFGLAAIGAFFSLSSGALLGLTIQLGLIGYRWITGVINLANRWMLLAGSVAAFALLIELASNRGIVRLFIGSFTLNPQTGYYRLLIWEYAGAEALRNPVFGIGVAAEWQRPSFMYHTSVDAYWLNLALQYGLPVAVGTILAAASVWFTVSACAKRLEAPERMILIGWLISFFMVSIIGLTVHYWHNSAAWYFFLMGLGAALIQIHSTDKIPEAPSRKSARPARLRKAIVQSTGR